MIDIQLEDLTEEQVQKRKKFEEQYEQKNRERLNFKDKKQEEKQRTKDPEELMLHIQKEFRAQYDVITNQLETKLIKTQEQIDTAIQQFKELQEYYFNKSYALTSFDKQQYKETLDQLECSLYNLRQVIVPRQPFKFSKPFAQATVKQQKVDTQDQKHQTDQRIVSPELPYSGEKFEGGSLVIRHIKDQNLELQGYLDTLYLLNLENTSVTIGDVKGSVWVDKSSRCTITGKMHQLRIHETHETTFIVYVTSKPIIERSSQLSFGALKNVESEGQNYWNDVQDFNWLKQDKSPNFQLIE